MEEAKANAALRRSAAVGCLALVCACAPSAKAPPSSVLPALPASFVAADLPGAVPSRWWTSFGDRDLDALIERALAANPTIAIAAARLAQARADAAIAGAPRYPSLAARLDAGTSGGGAIDRDFSELGLAVSWEIDLWNRIGAEARGAAAEALASQADLAALRQLVAAETARTYFAVIEAREQIALSTRVLETYDELIRQSRLRAEASLMPRNYYDLLVADRESARAGLALRREDYRRLVRRLDVLAADYPDGQRMVAGALPTLAPLPPTGVPSELLTRRPDIRAALGRVEAAGYRLDAARADLLPRLVLDGSTGGNAAGLAERLTGFWSIAGRLLQPIFEGGRLRARIDRAAGARDEALAAYADTVLQALLETETALAVGEDMAERQAAFAGSAAAAERAVEVSTLRYQAGIEPFFNVLESQQRALAARSAAVSATRAMLDNRIALHLALAGEIADTGRFGE